MARIAFALIVLAAILILVGKQNTMALAGALVNLVRTLIALFKKSAA
jgi:hypothetical protein